MSSIPLLGIFGDSGVGKTALTINYVKNHSIQIEKSSLEDYYFIKVLMDNGSYFDIQIADTSGQDDYLSLRDRYMDLSDVFLVVYSISKTLSFEKAESLLEQISIIRERKKFKFLLVGNQCEISNRKVSKEKGKMLAKKYQGKFLETSTLKNINIDQCFKIIVNILKSKKIDPEEDEQFCTCKLN